MGNAHLEKWRSLVDEFREKAGRLERDERAACAACTAEDRARVAEAQQFMEDCGIGDALCAVVWSVRRFAAWSSTIRAASIPPEYSDLEIVTDSLKDFAVRFTYRGRRSYGISFKERAARLAAQDDSRGEAYLTSDGTTVFGVSMASRAGAAYDDWHPTTIEALRPGEWIADLLEMHSAHRRVAEASVAEVRDRQTSRRATMISLE